MTDTKEHKSYICVGGSLAGKRFQSSRHSGFRVPVLQNSPHQEDEEYTPNKTLPIQVTEYREEVFTPDQGVVSFWVPMGQTPFESITMLLEIYERSYDR